MKATISNTNLTKSLINAAGISLFLFSLVLGFFVANFVSPVLAYETPFCTVTNGYSVCTDQADYTPSSTAHISGSGFSPGDLLVKVTRPDGSVVTGDGSFAPWPTAYDYVAVDSEGKFQFDYLLDGIEGQYLIEVLDSENNVLASHSFTDASSKVGSVTVGSQSGTLTQGTAGSVTYTVTVNRGTGSGSSGTFTADMNITTLLPSGATYSFSPNPISFESADTSKTSTLTITTTSATPAGTTGFTVKATRNDNANDFATGTGTLTINTAPDTTPPVITLLGSTSVTIEVHSTYTDAGATASDNYDGDITSKIVTANNVNQNVVGDYTVTYDVTDANGNAATQVVRNVHVVDTTPPIIASHDDVTEEATSSSGAVVTYTNPTVTDNYDSSVSVSCDPTSGSTFALGATTVTCSATDSNSNSATQTTFNVIVQDTTPPVITLLGTDPQTIEVGTAYSELGATALDNYDGDISASIVIDASTVNTNTVGSYVVTYDVTDAHGNSAVQKSRAVNVVDTTLPVITLLGTTPVTIEVHSAYTDAGATASDNYDGDLTSSIVTVNPVNKDVVGVYTVTYDVADSNGNSAAQVTRTVNVVDTTLPVITLVGANPQTIEVLNSYTELGATALDNYDGDLTGSIVIDASAVNTNLVGSYTVTYDVSDANSNSATQVTRTVNVVDTTPPVIAAHADLTIEATSSAGATVTYTNPTATDNYDSSITVSCTPVSGSTFALGETTVTCSAKDAAGNSAVNTTFNVKVQDTTPPTIDNVADITDEATSASGATVTIIPPTSHDAVDGDIVSSCDYSTGTFALGVTTVTCTKTDAAGNIATPKTFKVTVVDTTPPAVSVPTDITIEATGPNTVVNYSPLPSATDLVDGSVSVTCSKESGETFPVGETTVTCSATDSHSNTGTNSFKVTITDTTPPVITVSGTNPVTLEVHTPYVDAGATAADLVDTSVTVTSSGTVNVDVVGDYTIFYDAVDTAGNNAVQKSRIVHVVDTTLPVITLLGSTPVTIEIHSTYTDAGATAFDNYGGDLTSSIVTVNNVNNNVVGDYTVTYDVTDANGNAATQVVRTVHVVDTTLPVITLNGDNPLTIEVHTDYIESGAVVTDNYDSGLTASITGTVDKDTIGTYTLYYDAVDSSGNNAVQVTRTVNVVDTTPPIIASHDDVTEEATSSAGAIVTYTLPTATDNYDSSVSVSCSPVSGSTFALGATTVTCSATDSNGNSATQTTFNVIVQDTTPPVISNTPADFSVEATSSAGAVATYSLPTANDLVDGSITVICTPASGSTFGLGENVVDCEATDAHSNKATSSFKITVVDTTPPTLNLPADITGEATGSSGAIVSFTATATDIVDGPVVTVCTPVSGSTFALGTTPVSCSATDSHGNTATGSFNIIIEDTTAPTIDAHGDVTAEATSASGAIVTYTSPASYDAVDGDGTAACLPSSGSLFSLGDTTVTCTATDAAGNSATPTNFKVTVQDTTPPVITVSGTNPVTLEVHTSYVDAGATVADLVDSSVTVTSTGAVNVDVVGDYTITYNAIDAAGNNAVSQIRTVHVVDTTPPVIDSHADVIAEATSSAGATVTYTNPTATDNYDSSVSVSCSPASGSLFVLGTTTVTCTATDSHSNVAIPTAFNVIIQDTTAPIITLLGSTSVTIEVHSTYTDAGATALDNYDGDLTSSIVSVNPVNEDVVGTYTITYDVADSNGNSATQLVRTVNVVDTTAPVITVTGGDETIEVHTPYTDAGATATDNYDLIVTVTSSGTVNVDVIGDYTIFYDAVDTAGNHAVQKSRIVHVVDTVAPTCSITEPLANSYLHGTASIKISASDSGSGISSVEWSLNNSTWVPTIFDGTSYSAVWNTTGVADGIHTIYGRAIDNAGLITYDPVDVVVDNTPPVITIVSPENITYSTNSVSLTFAVNESTSSVVYSLDGGSNVTATNTTFSRLANGLHNLILYATDLANNENSEKVLFTILVPPAPKPTQTNRVGGVNLEATISSSNVSTRSPKVTSQVIVQNGRLTLWNPVLVVDSVCKEKITPNNLDAIKPNESVTFTIDFDCKDIAYGEYPVTYTLQLTNGRKIASKTYTLKITEAGVSIPNVVILSTMSTSLSPGESETVIITLQNTGDGNTSGNVALDVPDGLSVTPLNIPISLQPSELKNVSFKVTASQSAGASTGLGPLTGFASFFGVDTPSNAKLNVSIDYETPNGVNTLSKPMEINILPRFPYFLVVLLALLFASFYFYFYHRKKPKGESK